MLRIYATVVFFLLLTLTAISQDNSAAIKSAEQKVEQAKNTLSKEAQELKANAKEQIEAIKAERAKRAQSGHDHDGHDHGSHEGYNHGSHDGHNHDHKGHDHGSHEGHDHGSHKHDDHKGHDHGAHDGHDHGSHDGHDHHYYSVLDSNKDCGSGVKSITKSGYDPTATAIHHISDANVWTIMDMVRIPLPAILYNKTRGLEMFSTGKFSAGPHDNGHYGYKDYVLFEGNIHRITCPDFKADGKYEVQGFDMVEYTNEEGKKADKRFAIVNNKAYKLEQKVIWDAGILGGGPSNFYDLSPTKNVVSMGLVSLLLFLLFRGAAKKYKGDPSAPSGVQSFLEPMFQFIRDDVAIPFLGDKHEKFLPLLMTIFFFILGLNLWGQIPFLGNVNVTGSLTVTAVMAIVVFILTNINGNGDYWKHILWPPDTPWFVKIILIPVELLGLLIKPLTLMLRLAGNITAGHIAILSFVGLIFIFGKAGTNMAGSLTGTALAIPLTMFMMAIELIVAFVQAFVFTILTASYLGAATEEHHHDDHH